VIRFGLCCIFFNEPIKFRRTTAKHLMTKSRHEQLRLLGEICMHNAQALAQALSYCHVHGIGAFRINSQILPLKTHPEVGYEMTDLPNGADIIKQFRRCGLFSRKHDIRTTFHPDQFIVLGSSNPEVVQRSIADLNYHAEVAQWVNADVINIHGGGAYGDKESALDRLAGVIKGLPAAVRRRLTVENDDRVYTPGDLLPLCLKVGIPLVYDVHHHRCLPDELDVHAATTAALKTWNREPLFHLSSPLLPWGNGNCRSHRDEIDPADFPCEWRHLDVTVEVEAKFKEIAVLSLIKTLPGHLRIRCGKK